MSKVVDQVIASLSVAALLGGVGFAWSTNQSVTQLKEQNKAIAAQISRIEAEVSRVLIAGGR